MGKKQTRKEKKLEKLKKTVYQDIVDIKRFNKSNLYDVQLNKLSYIGKYSSFECHFVLYPYSRGIYSQHIEFYPFEEYVKDISTGQRSAYVKITSNFNEIFGLLLGAIIVLIGFLFLDVKSIFSIEAIGSILGAYFIGKELWDDIEKILIKLTRKRKTKYQENYYEYEKSGHSTLTNYSYFAKKNRYNKTSVLPDMVDFIPKSNSKTVRMFFKSKTLSPYIGESSIHLLSIHINSKMIEEFEKWGYLVGVKLSYNRRCFLWTNRFEQFQSINNGFKGCLDENGNWIENAIFYRKTSSLGKIRS